MGPVTLPAETDTSTATVSSGGPQQGTAWNVTITRVIDGDTVEARFPNGELDTVRLLGVDTPETTLGRVTPAEFDGIPDTTAGRDHLFNWGERATAFAEERLNGTTVRIEVDPTADRRGGFGRLLVYVHAGEQNLNRQLLAEGYARVYESTFSMCDEFRAAEATAQENAVGLWNFSEDASTVTTTEGPLAIAEIHADAAGNDNDNLNDEYVIFENTGATALDLGGWTITDSAEHTYMFQPGVSLDPGGQLTLHTGSGTNTETDRYWGASSAIWNNDGDTVTVRDDEGEIVLERTYR
ncbi:MAG: lamin tail domain-containing protein [Halorhabdus sp.]